MPDTSLISKITPRVLLFAFVIVCSLAIIGAAVTTPVTLAAYNPSWDGTSTARTTIASATGDQPVIVDTAAYNQFQATDTLAIILAPRESYSQSEITEIQAFVGRGGTILVAEDQRTETNQLLDELGVDTRIDGQPVRDPRQYYRNPAAPVITDIASNSTINGTTQFTLNRGTVLRSTDGTAIANTSEFAYIDENGNEQLDRTEQLRSYPVLSSEQVGEGRVLVLSDPSVFINQMLDREGNRALLDQLIASHRHVILDYSHAPGTTPMIELWLWLYRTAWAQAALAASIGLVVLLWIDDQTRIQTRTLITRVKERFNRQPLTDAVHLSPEERITFLKNRHPEWDPNRIQRIAESMDELNDHPRSKEQSSHDTYE